MSAAIVSSGLHDYTQHSLLANGFHQSKAVAQHNGFAIREDTTNISWNTRKLSSQQQQPPAVVHRLTNQPPQTLQLFPSSTPNCLTTASAASAMTVQNQVAAAVSPNSNQRLVFPPTASNSALHRKLDRSFSEPVQNPQQLKQFAVQQQQVVAAVAQQLTAAVQASQQQQPQTPTTPQTPTNSSRYKTELCRPFEESGTCKYGDKCQFAHGEAELRSLARHPKYKTELCRTFHTSGLCPYGPRCHFIHNNDETRKSLGGIPSDLARPGVAASLAQNRPKALSIGSVSLGSAGELSPPSSPTLYDDAFNPTSVFAAGFGAGPFSTATDFSALVNNSSLMRNTGNNFSNASSVFGGSQPSLMNGPFSAGMTLGDVFRFPNVPVPQRQTQQSIINGTNAHQLAQRSISLNNPVNGIISEGPPSPVDSLSSELESVSLASTASPAPGSRLGNGSPQSRLPIFNQLAGAGSISE